ncbi:4106_t:CDS:2 [Funneliformis geosporum]|nr:4106_t:CDS:2 [Funneliformis geosporum]
MYGIKFQSETVINYKDLNRFESGLVTLFNTQTIEQEYLWNSSLRDKCRHCHAAILFKETQQREYIEIVNEAKVPLRILLQKSPDYITSIIKKQRLLNQKDMHENCVKLCESHGAKKVTSAIC